MHESVEPQIDNKLLPLPIISYYSVATLNVMGKSPAEIAHNHGQKMHNKQKQEELEKRCAEAQKDTVTSRGSPNSRQSSRLAKIKSPEIQQHSQLGKRSSYTGSPSTGTPTSAKNSPAHNPPLAAISSIDNNDSTPIKFITKDISRRPIDYVERFLSYKDPETDRHGVGVVGSFDVEQNKYEVQFTFTDNEAPFKHTDRCPLQWVEENMIHNDTYNAWSKEVGKHLELDSPKGRLRRTPASSSTANQNKPTKTKRKTAENAYKPDDDDTNDGSEGDTPMRNQTNKKRRDSQNFSTQVLLLWFYITYAKRCMILDPLQSASSLSCTGIVQNHLHAPKFLSNVQQRYVSSL
jgi:hypothetical protein